MKVIEILKEWRKSGDLDFFKKNGLFDDITKRKVELLEDIFEQSNFATYKNEQIKIVRMYYKEISSAPTIAKIMNMSQRNVYRMRDSCVKWLSDLLDREE